MFHTVYKTTNLVNGKFYIGYHKTDDPQDAYLGSGKYLRNAIAKYGAANFIKEVLFSFSDAASALAREEKLVEVFRTDPLCMNIRKGGSGGFDYINQNGLTTGRTPEGKERIRQSKLGIKRPKQVGQAVAKANRQRTGWSHSESARQQIQKANQEFWAGKTRIPWNKGKPWSQEIKDKLSKAALNRKKIDPVV
jgi:hypothetical protein